MLLHLVNNYYELAVFWELLLSGLKVFGYEDDTHQLVILHQMLPLKAKGVDMMKNHCSLVGIELRISEHSSHSSFAKTTTI